MFPHRFRRWDPQTDEETTFFRNLRQGSFRGLFENVIERMMCIARTHIGPLQIDDKGFFRTCVRCGHTENIASWAIERRKMRLLGK